MSIVETHLCHNCFADSMAKSYKKGMREYGETTEGVKFASELAEKYYLENITNRHIIPSIPFNTEEE